MFKRINSWITKLYIRQYEIREEMKETLTNQRGAGAVEYGLVIAVIVVMVILAAKVMDEPLKKFFKAVVDTVMQFVQ